MTVAKIQEALVMVDALDDVLQDISPTRTPSWNWDEMTHDRLRSIRRMLEKELVHQEQAALARYMQSSPSQETEPAE